MSRELASPTRAVVAAVVLTLVALVALLALLRSTGPGSAEPGADGGHQHGPSLAEAITTTADITAPGAPLDPAEAPASTVGTTAETSLADAAAAGSPDARDLDALGTPRADTAPSEVLAEGAATLGGCRTEYGSAGQCLPVVPPSQSAHVQDMIAAGLDPAGMDHRWSCAELNRYFPDGIAVRSPGVDPDELDHDDDGVACGRTD